MFFVRRVLLFGIVLWATACGDTGVQPPPGLEATTAAPVPDLAFWFPPTLSRAEEVGGEVGIPSGPEQIVGEVEDGGFPPFFKVTTAGVSFTPDNYGHWIAHSSGYQESYAWGLRNDTYLSVAFEGDRVVNNQHAATVARYGIGGFRQLNSRSSASVWESCGNTASGQTMFTIWTRDVSRFPPLEYGHRSKTVTAQPTSQPRCTTDVLIDTDGGGSGGGGGGEDTEATDWAAITCWYRVYYSDGTEVARELLYCEAVLL